MKFTVERAALVNMLKLSGRKPPNQKHRDKLVRLSACAARVFVEANEMTGGVEALVLENGTCLLVHEVFHKLLKTYAPKAHMTIEANERAIKFGSTTLAVSGYSRVVTPPGKFQVFPVTDLGVLSASTQPSEAGAEEPPAQSPPVAAPLSELESNRRAAKEVADDPLAFSLGFDHPPYELLPPEHATQETEPPTVAPHQQQLELSPTEATGAAVRKLGWDFFAPEILERLFVVYTHKNELNWAERMWAVLAARGLTAYATAAEYNRVLVRMAVLARFFKCWVWKAYGDYDDLFLEYDEWFEVLPLVRSALPAFEPNASQSPDAAGTTGAMLYEMIHGENDAVFEAVIASCGKGEEMALALDLRHAAGVGDDFGSHVKYDGDGNNLANQKAFFNEYGFSAREFDCVSILIGNRFNF